MKIIEPGHVYGLEITDKGEFLQSDLNSDIEKDQWMRLTFVNREDGKQHSGTQTQEVLRALIDRTMHCDNCLRWEGNDKIIYHLRMALVLHEARALERKTEKGLLAPERVAFEEGGDGHFTLEQQTANEFSEDAVKYDLEAAQP